MDEPFDNTPAGLRRVAEAGRRALDENKALKRELAMRRAGIPVDTSMARLFDQAYGGPEDDDSIREAWAILQREALSSAGVEVVETSPGVFAPAPQDIVFSESEMASTAERQALANGAAYDPLPDPHPNVVADRQMEMARASGARDEDALGVWLQSKVQSAMAGDSRAIWEANR